MCVHWEVCIFVRVDSIAAGGQWRETKRGVVPQQGKCIYSSDVVKYG